MAGIAGNRAIALLLMVALLACSGSFGVRGAEAARLPFNPQSHARLQLLRKQDIAQAGCGNDYNHEVDELYREEVEPRFVAEGDAGGSQTFLDSTASQLYLNSQVDRVAELLKTNVFGNPHSASPSSQRTAHVLEAVKSELLELFSARPDQWELVFTRSATGALHMIGETFPWSQASALVLLRSNHNSVLGIREDACAARARLGTADPAQVEEWLSEIEEARAAGNLLRAARLGTQGPLTRSWATGEGLAPPSMCKGPAARECGVADAPASAATRSFGGGAQQGASPEAGEGREAQEEGQEEEQEEQQEAQEEVQNTEEDVGQVMTCNYSLFAYPAADNVNGELFPLSWIDRLHRIPASPDRPRLSPPGAGAGGSDRLKCTGTRHHWLVLLDTAAFVPHHPLNLTEVQPDFAVISFYKMFGLPTGVGALLVRKDVARLLWPRYWAGGAIFTATAAQRWQCFHQPPQRLELGTPAFLEVVSLRAGLEALQRLGGIQRVHGHTRCVGRLLASKLSALRHSNGAPMLRLFGRWEEELQRQPEGPGGQQGGVAATSRRLRRARGPQETGAWRLRHEQEEAADHHDEPIQGPTANFIMLDPQGAPLSHRVVGQEASEAGLHLRVGCMCGPGTCYRDLGLRDAEVCEHAIALARAAHPGDESWQEEDWEFLEVNRTGVDGLERTVRLPLGTVRASFGWLSRWEDAQALACHLEASYQDLTAEQVYQRYRNGNGSRKRGLRAVRPAGGASSVVQCSGG